MRIKYYTACTFGIVIALTIIFSVEFFLLDIGKTNMNVTVEYQCEGFSGAEAIRIDHDAFWGYYVYTCELDIGKSYTVIINSTHGDYEPIDFIAEKSFAYWTGLYDEMSPSGKYYVYLYSEANYETSSDYYYEGHSSFAVFITIMQDLWIVLPMFLIIVSIGFIALHIYEKRKKND